MGLRWDLKRIWVSDVFWEGELDGDLRVRVRVLMWRRLASLLMALQVRSREPVERGSDVLVSSVTMVWMLWQPALILSGVSMKAETGDVSSLCSYRYRRQEDVFCQSGLTNVSLKDRQRGTWGDDVQLNMRRGSARLQDTSGFLAERFRPHGFDQTQSTVCFSRRGWLHLTQGFFQQPSRQTCRQRLSWLWTADLNNKANI